jgi:hypothetical protein
MIYKIKHMPKSKTFFDQFISDQSGLLTKLLCTMRWQAHRLWQQFCCILHVAQELRQRIRTRHTGASVQLFLLRNMSPSAIISSSDAWRCVVLTTPNRSHNTKQFLKHLSKPVLLHAQTDSDVKMWCTTPAPSHILHLKATPVQTLEKTQPTEILWHWLQRIWYGNRAHAVPHRSSRTRTAGDRLENSLSLASSAAAFTLANTR